MANDDDQWNALNEMDVGASQETTQRQYCVVMNGHENLDELHARLLNKATKVLTQYKARSGSTSVQKAMKLKKRIPELVYVIPEFSGALYDHLIELKARIYSPLAIIQSMKKYGNIVRYPKPLLALSCVGFNICATGIEGEERSTLFAKAQALGAVVTGALDPKTTTHLFATECNPESEKYRSAAEHKIPIVKPAWINFLYESAAKGKLLAENDLRMEEFCVPIFSQCVVTTSGFNGDNRLKIAKLVEENGGTFNGNMDRQTCTHLIIDSNTGEKYRKAMEWKSVNVVSLKWLTSSVERNVRLYESKYHPGQKTSSQTSRNATLTDPGLSAVLSSSSRNVPSTTAASNASVLAGDPKALQKRKVLKMLAESCRNNSVDVQQKRSSTMSELHAPKEMVDACVEPCDLSSLNNTPIAEEVAQPVAEKENDAPLLDVEDVDCNKDVSEENQPEDEVSHVVEEMLTPPASSSKKSFQPADEPVNNDNLNHSHPLIEYLEGERPEEAEPVHLNTVAEKENDDPMLDVEDDDFNKDVAEENHAEDDVSPVVEEILTPTASSSKKSLQPADEPVNNENLDRSHPASSSKKSIVSLQPKDEPVNNDNSILTPLASSSKKSLQPVNEPINNDNLNLSHPLNEYLEGKRPVKLHLPFSQLLAQYGDSDEEPESPTIDPIKLKEAITQMAKNSCPSDSFYYRAMGHEAKDNREWRDLSLYNQPVEHDFRSPLKRALPGLPIRQLLRKEGFEEATVESESENEMDGEVAAAENVQNDDDSPKPNSFEPMLPPDLLKLCDEVASRSEINVKMYAEKDVAANDTFSEDLIIDDVKDENDTSIKESSPPKCEWGAQYSSQDLKKFDAEGRQMNFMPPTQKLEQILDFVDPDSADPFQRLSNQSSRRNHLPVESKAEDNEDLAPIQSNQSLKRKAEETMESQAAVEPPSKRGKRNSERRYNHVIFTTFDQDEIAKLQAQVDSIQGTNPNDTTDMGIADIVVCNKLQRSEKIVTALAAGKFIVPSTYIIQSARQNRWLDIEEYEYGNPKSAKKRVNLSCTNDPQAAEQIKNSSYRMRIKAETSGHGAFHGWKVILFCTPQAADSHVRIIKAGGGEAKLFTQVLYHEYKQFTMGLITAKTLGVFSATERDMLNQHNIPYYTDKVIPDYLLSTDTEDALKRNWHMWYRNHVNSGRKSKK